MSVILDDLRMMVEKVSALGPGLLQHHVTHNALERRQTRHPRSHRRRIVEKFRKDLRGIYHTYVPSAYLVQMEYGQRVLMIHPTLVVALDDAERRAEEAWHAKWDKF